MNEAEEKIYESGRRAAIVEMLSHCLRELDIDDPEKAKLNWVKERERTISMLRQVCTEFGDNDWPDNLYLPDVIEKYIWRNLEVRRNDLRKTNHGYISSL